MESHYNETIARMQVSKKMYELLKMTTGSHIVRRKMVFNLEKPEIELYEILDLIYELRQTRKGFNSCVYIHQCMDNTYYVGYAEGKYLKESIERTAENMMISRLNDHRNSGGTITPTNMTYLFPVVSCIGFFPGDKEDEDLMTILMSKFAGNNVRGGKWASPFITANYPEISVNDIKNRLRTRIKP
jgi:uncharacterized UPF0146 family protein